MPTAHVFCAEVASIPSKLSLVCDPGFGLGMRCQALPFQCTIRVRRSLPDIVEPTAQALSLPVTVTPLKISPAAGPPGLGLGTVLQAFPFQCKIKVCDPEFVPLKPVAQALDADVASTADRTFVPEAPAGFGLGTFFQLLPFQCKMSVAGKPLLLNRSPTAQAS